MFVNRVDILGREVITLVNGFQRAWVKSIIWDELVAME